MALGDATANQPTNVERTSLVQLAINMMVTENREITVPNASVNFSSPDDLISAYVKHQTINVS